MEAVMSGSLLLVAVAVGAPALKAPPAGSGLAGEWRIESLTVGGQKDPQPEEPDFVVFGPEGTLSSRRGAAGPLIERGRFTARTENEPATIDIDRGSSDGPFRGIYRVEGETLTLCLAADGKATRPQAFASRPKSDDRLYVLKRIKK